MIIDILSYLPFHIRKLKEYQNLSITEDAEIEKLFNEIDRLYDNAFISTLDESGCERWERILGIVIRDTDTIDFRKMRIKSFLVGQLPYSLNKLKSILNAMCGGENQYELTIDYTNYAVNILIELTSQALFEEFKRLLNEIMPCNLKLTIQLRFNNWGTVRDFTWSRFTSTTWTQIRTEVL